MATTASSEPLSSTIITARGWGVALVGVATGAVGMGIASPVVVYVGVAMVSATAVAAVWMLLSVHTFLLRFPYARREVAPRPLTVGRPGRVTVGIRSGTALTDERGAARQLARAITAGLDIREQAAAELTGGLGTKATVSRAPDALTLSYMLEPTRRGRWPIGPALVHTSDPFGFLATDTAVGGSERIAVWPATVDLSDAAGALMGHADRIVLGARTPSPDDASLRDYRDGDDLRRVHWKSTARRGTMLVRSDERAGRRPATVIMDLPRDDQAIEWTISAAASIAVSVLESGHPVRLLGGGIHPDATGHEHQGSATARAHVLNQTVDLKPPVSANAAENDVLAAARDAAHTAASGEVTIGVFEPLPKSALDQLVAIGEHGRAWAIVRLNGQPDHDEAVSDTVTSLRRAGWRAVTASDSDSLDRVWTTLVTSGDLE